MNKTIAIIISVLNEEEAIPYYLEKANEILTKDTKHNYTFTFVDDGSTDKTLDILKEYSKKQDNVFYISLSRNQGQNAASLAGLTNTKGDYYLCMDVDLQDPLETVIEMAEKLDEGYDIAVGVRGDRQTDTAAKRSTAELFYKTINKLEGKEIFIYNSNIFRMMTKQVRDEIVKNTSPDFSLMTELNLVGFKQAFVYYKREERTKGHTKYNFRKLLTHAENTMIASTSRPLFISLKICVGLLIFGFISFITTMILLILSCTYEPMVSQVYGFPIYLSLFILSCLIILAGVILVPISIMSIYQTDILINARNKKNYHIRETNLDS